MFILFVCGAAAWTADVKMGEPGSPIPLPPGGFGRAQPLRRGSGKPGFPTTLSEGLFSRWTLFQHALRGKKWPGATLKSNSSFFRMLAVGAVGARAVQQYLNSLGHDIVELERGSLATRIWRDVKRKRVRLLRTVLEDATQPLFVRSACAWAIGCHGTKEAAEVLVQAFADVAAEIREEALVALYDLGAVGFDPLLKGLEASSAAIAAGAAETLRRIHGPPAKEIAALAERSSSTWPTWTLAHLSKDAGAPYVAALQPRQPDVHYAISVLWNFLESWIAHDWTPRATP